MNTPGERTRPLAAPDLAWPKRRKLRGMVLGAMCHGQLTACGEHIEHRRVLFFLGVVREHPCPMIRKRGGG